MYLLKAHFNVIVDKKRLSNYVVYAVYVSMCGNFQLLWRLNFKIVLFLHLAYYYYIAFCLTKHEQLGGKYLFELYLLIRPIVEEMRCKMKESLSCEL